MTTGNDRILTTHVGSLPRNGALTDLLIRRESGEEIDTNSLAAEMDSAVAVVTDRQRAAGIDIGNDGEQQRVGFQTYVPQRMSGFGGESKRNRPLDYIEFPRYAETLPQRFPKRGRSFNAPQAVGEMQYHDDKAIKAEIARFQAHAGQAFADTFMTAPSPGIVATTMLNAFYDSHEAYLAALARELSVEYRAIHDAGIILQIDAPDLAMERTMFFQDMDDATFLRTCELHVAALNVALDGIPANRIRLHCCWGNWEGPHTHDIPVADVLPILCQANVGALSIEFANPRHAHEYKSLARYSLPDGMVLLPGVIDSTSNFVEHPELVAGRIKEAVAAVGDRERVIASTDCGFGTFAGFEWVAEDVVWAKLRALSEGARMATTDLWGKA